MAAIKFSKQNIQPNPLEVDYWVDITSNPYGGNIKYHNGYDWVDLLNSKGTPINLDAYYNKVLMNQMLAGKASVESVDSKVDDTEVADVIKNIEFKDRGDDGVEMVVLKYNDMTVGVTLPVASNTTSGIITNKSFKDLVKQNQLQGVYSEMYDKLSEIRQQYQRKLKAGKNIQIDSDNTIHAVGKISLDWDDVYNKPDFDRLFATVALAIQSESTRAKNAEQQLSARITDHVDVVESKLELKADANSVYTKDQIDEKISGIYKIKGSRKFQDLPTSGNNIGDVYNITNNFALDGVEYPFGTNVVYTATGWDALAGIFDSTEIENKVDEIDTKVDEEVIRAKEKELELDKKFDNYLPLKGGTLTAKGDTTILYLHNSTNWPYVKFVERGSTTSALGSKDGDLVFYDHTGKYTEGWHALLHKGNYSNYALPLTGGTVNGKLAIKNGTDSTPFSITSDNSTAAVKLITNNGSGFLLYNGSSNWMVTDTGWSNQYKIYHEGNFNPSDYLPLSGGTITDGLLTIKRNPSVIRFNDKDNLLLGYLGIQNGNPVYYNSTSMDYKIWHEGNDGEGSGLDADKLDGVEGKRHFVNKGWVNLQNDTQNAFGVYYFGGVENNNDIQMSNGIVLSFLGFGNDDYPERRGVQFKCPSNGSIYYRQHWGGYTPWKQLAFTDSTVNNATKLNNKPASNFYDLTGGTEIPNNSDLNDYKTVGTYYINWSLNGLANMPILLAGTLKVYLPNGNPEYIGQTYTIYSDGYIYYRLYTKSLDKWSDWKKITDDMSNHYTKNQINTGYFKDMRVGLADDLGGIEEKVESEYTIQPTANPSEIRDGYALIESLKGNSIVWNQQVQFSNLRPYEVAKNNITTTITNDTITITNIAYEGDGGDPVAVYHNTEKIVIGNKILVVFNFTSSNPLLQPTVEYGDVTHIVKNNSNNTYHEIYTTTKSTNILLLKTTGTKTIGDTWSFNNPIVVNLTKMFGAGNEPETIEEFYARIPQGIDLYAYNEGEIINLTADSIKSIGFNQWDEEWEVGWISGTNGSEILTENTIRSKNFCRCLPDTDYYLRCGSYTNRYYLAILWYDDLFGFIKGEYNSANIVKSPEDAKYFKITTNNGTYIYGNTYNNDICINISDPDKNGTYEPYKGFVRQLPTNLFEGGMKSAGTAYDEIYWDKNKKKYIKVTRVGRVDWNNVYIEYREDYKRLLLSTTNKKLGNINVISSRYVVNTAPVDLNQSIDKVICGYYDRYNIYIHDFDYTDVESYRTAMKEQGVEIYYELAEPIIEKLDIPYMDYEVSNDGTEIIESDTPTTPIKANVVYNFDAINTIKQNRFDISDIKKGATKLAKPVKLWGNDFDGSSDINKNMLFANNLHIFIKDTNDNSCSALTLNHYNILSLGYGTSDKGYTTTVYGTPIRFYTGSDNEHRMVIAKNGNIGIGTIDPQYKLDVDGTTYSKLFVAGNNIGYYSRMSDNNDVSIMYLSNSDNLIIGLGTAEKLKATYIHGNNIIFRSKGDLLQSMIINPSGNVTIGSSNLAGTDYKLYADGNSMIKGYMTIVDRDSYLTLNPYIGNRVYIQSGNMNNPNGSLNVTGYNNQLLNEFVINSRYVQITDQITSGDLVDWYGVSWSENSSNPTCTRIGNMALHRSLPILNAMKGYVITIPSKTDGEEVILPIDDTFSKTEYDYLDNDTHAITAYKVTSNIMIKIPEFWYIDDYESSTKTHNLKISQTAKAGWCHHKEAYVGAYEGCNDSTCYRSTKNVIPIVSATRTTLRSFARANGYEYEYKWNIYTYEEHRAICHLFLVEYATRNSQLAVNTTLTADGFKQGGLGSGCTTGAVTINGQTTYSFIPTGTTDSLGNGSGQVAYTVTQTDEDGNEIGTVTRYANRYRGIENPFGHIFKYVDDIVNVYNAESGNKIVYKCNKPEHFATNKNTKYKPLCSFPGGSKTQGWSKEIKATINCDFFKYSVGGSESTYWCDYNYDNNDTSEHCMLIGGCSSDGIAAGLFDFVLYNGVGISGANFGSRLTYLPWAE